MDFIKLIHDPLSIEEVIQLVSDSSCGAISSFIGTTRDNFECQKVNRLEYEAYDDMAIKEIKKICKETRVKWEVKKIAVYHRLGAVDIKEASIIIAVSSEHRKESLEAVSFLIDALKASVPIWKKEFYENGDSEWKRNKECLWANQKKTSEASTIKMQSVNEHDSQVNQFDDNISLNIKAEVDSIPASPVLAHRDIIEEKPKAINPSFVQIVATKEEIERRIEAFQKLKREELNVLNIQDFCIQPSDEGESCARTSAVVLRSKDSSTHLKLTKVVNEWGPQTEGIDPGSHTGNITSPISEGKIKIIPNVKTEVKRDVMSCFASASKSNRKRELPGGIEERLSNMEEHLNMEVGNRVPSSMFRRIKDLENRILYLESLSPEYFNSFSKIQENYCQTNKIRKIESDDEDDNILNSIDARLFELKKKLKRNKWE